MHDAREIANWFLLRAEKEEKAFRVSNILRLCFLAQGWHLEMRKSALFRNRIEAWSSGPLTPDIYHAFQSQGHKPLKPLQNFRKTFPDYDESYLEQIYQIYGRLDSAQLSDLCETEGGPWHNALRTRGRFAQIFDQDIKVHFENLRLKSDLEKHQTA